MTRIVKIVTVDPTRYKDHVPVFVAPTLNQLQGILVAGSKRYQTELRKTGREKDPPIHVAIHEVDERGDPKLNNGKPIPPPMELTEETQIAILPNDQYDMSNPSDALIIDMLKASEFFVRSRSEYNPASLERVTIDDPEVNARRTNTTANKVLSALSMLHQQTATGKADLAFLLKQPVMRMTAEQIDAYLNKVAMESPDLLLELFRVADFPARVLLVRSVNAGLISQRGAAFYNGEECIGLDEAQAVSWLKTPSNDSFVSTLIGQLRQKNSYSEGHLISGSSEKQERSGSKKQGQQESA